MLNMARELQKRTPQEKEKLLIEIQNMGVTVGLELLLLSGQ